MITFSFNVAPDNTTDAQVRSRLSQTRPALVLQRVAARHVANVHMHGCQRWRFGIACWGCNGTLCGGGQLHACILLVEVLMALYLSGTS